MDQPTYQAQAEEAIAAASVPGLHCYDCETWLIRPGLLTPRLVCTSYQGPGMSSPALLDRADSIRLWRILLANDQAHHLGHNTKFDIRVLIHAAGGVGVREMFQAYEEGRVWDTAMRMRLLDLSIDGDLKRRRYSLAACGSRMLGVDRSSVKKGPDAWRLRYAELDEIPIWEWPDAAVEYPLDDVRDTIGVFQACGGIEGALPSEQLKNSADWCLGLISLWGVKSEREATAVLRAALELEIVDLEVPLVASGLLRKTGSKNTKLLKTLVAETYESLGLLVPETDKGAVKTAKDVLERIAGQVPILDTYVRRNLLVKRLNDYVVKALEKGFDHPICPGYAALKETGRTSSFGALNIQQIPREGGIRECFVPREGYCYISCDYDSLESRGWAEVCEQLLGWSSLADRFREDPNFDPHTFFACQILKIEYEEGMRRKKAGDAEIKRLRQGAKAANFGYPGGLGVDTFVIYAKALYGLELTREEGARLRDVWLSTWAEAKHYLARISDMTEFVGSCTVEQLMTGRIRAGCTYTQAANTLFQGLAADGANYALFMLSRECYGVTEGPLNGARIVAFIHDEFLLEIPNPSGRLDGPEVVAGMRQLERHMIDGMQIVVTGVPICCEAVAAKRWGKL